jgi:hypothetical protein
MIWSLRMFVDIRDVFDPSTFRFGFVLSHSCANSAHEWGTRRCPMDALEKQILRVAYPTDDESSAGPQTCSAQDDTVIWQI